MFDVISFKTNYKSTQQLTVKSNNALSKNVDTIKTIQNKIIVIDGEKYLKQSRET